MAEPLELASFYDLSQVTDLAVSPDGERAAFVADEFDPDADERLRSLFVAPADGSRDPHRLTRASEAGDPTWSPDGSRLGFLAARDRDVGLRTGRREDDGGDEDGEADENGEADEDGEADGDGADGSDEGDEGADDGSDEPKPQVWVFDLARGGDARQVTDREEGVRGFDWSPDGERFVIAARDPTDEQAEALSERREGGPIEVERLQHKADGVGWLDDVRTYLFVVDADGGEPRRLDEAYGAGAREPSTGLQPAWGEGGIAFLSNRTDRPDDSGVMDVYLIRPDGSALRKLTDSELRAGGLRWAPSGERLAFVGGNPWNWYEPSDVFVADAAADEYESVSADLDRTPSRLGVPAWVDEDTLICPFADEGWTRLVRLHVDGSPERVFEAQGRSRTVKQFDVGGGTVGVSLSTPSEGHDVFALDAGALDDGSGAADEGSGPTRLSALNADLLDGAALPASRRVTYRNDDGVEVEAIAYLPEDLDPEDPDPRPTVVSVHGGPMSYDAPEFRWDVAYWTGQGYVVLKPNYRGSVSYGRAFAERLKGSRGDLETDDVESGVDALAERGWTDPDRAFVTGFSYGGITTAHVVTRTDRFAAAAAEHGIYDFYSLFGTDDNHLWHEWEFGLPWEEPETFREISSITDVGEIETPLLVTAGEGDWRCPPTQAEQLYVSVRKRGVDAKLVVYQDEHHGVNDPDRAIHRLRTLTEWFSEYDQGEQGGAE